MYHDRRHPPGNHGVAVRHRQRQVLVRGDQRLGCRGAGPRRFGERLDERREVGSPVGEQVVDPALGEKCQIGFCYSVDSKFVSRHPTAPVKPFAMAAV